MPRMAYFTGDLNIHDLEFGRCGLLTPTFSALSPDFSFVPRWHPKFISQLVSEDWCHLNGLAMVLN
ncbi:DUF4915 domain-containing protein [Nostoc sp. CALU 1950]|uniref:DUF4915 domain-containing protein n=1 Tax=Nostoc sp. CALU 1950 TaxID=3104321 RepID=UPI003EBE082D